MNKLSSKEQAAIAEILDGVYDKLHSHPDLVRLTDWQLYITADPMELLYAGEMYSIEGDEE